MNYIDIHGHINFPEYDADREEVIKRAHDAGVGIIVVGTDLESSRRCVELAEKHEEMWAIVGMHPMSASGTEMGGTGEARAFYAAAFNELAANPRVVAIGECGLDYFHSKSEDVAYQKEVFLQHIEVANKVKKPLMLHVRNAKVISHPLGGGVLSDSPRGFEERSHSPKKDAPVDTNAYQEAIQILKDHAKVPANFHFFAGTIEDMKAAFEIDCSVSFTGVVTFTHDYDELIKSAPIEKMMTETDCPFVAPIPHRGKRNEPVFVIEVVKQIAKIRGENELEVAKQVQNNAKKFFGI